ncbi:sporulation inhibitor of replication protein SirA [Virgibacillus doumboii]|uniref:sporulation inhibitor of replication protein SirA n=1 Tax=Virgibacillus doumboii TaxID=2697503 RepID=UPI0013DF3123|nr:sporulation inhibitor of replication protein SirA [Virgibacillus doumboii]
MNHYSIYWIKEEFAHYFFHKSDVLYRFIKDYENDKSREDLKKQFEYITMNFQKDSLIAHLNDNYSETTNLKAKEDCLQIYKDMKYISLHIHNKHLNFHSEMLQDAEDLLFPALRQFQPYLFIVGNNLHNYGWISPVSPGKKDRKEQVLYSYL